MHLFLFNFCNIIIIFKNIFNKYKTTVIIKNEITLIYKLLKIKA